MASRLPEYSSKTERPPSTGGVSRTQGYQVQQVSSADGNQGITGSVSFSNFHLHTLLFLHAMQPRSPLPRALVQNVRIWRIDTKTKPVFVVEKPVFFALSCTSEAFSLNH